MKEKYLLHFILRLILFFILGITEEVNAFVFTKYNGNNNGIRGNYPIMKMYEDTPSSDLGFSMAENGKHSRTCTTIDLSEQTYIQQNLEKRKTFDSERAKEFLKKIIVYSSLYFSVPFIVSSIDYSSLVPANNNLLKKVLPAKVNAATIFGIDITPKPPSPPVEPNQLELVNYREPAGLFHTNLPKSFYSKRKDDNDGILFISGDFSKGIAMR